MKCNIYRNRLRWITEIHILLLSLQQLPFSNPEHLLLKRKPEKRERTKMNFKVWLRTKTIKGQCAKKSYTAIVRRLWLLGIKMFTGSIKVLFQNLFLFFRPKTGFQIWLEENRSSILSDNPHFEETEIIKEGMVRYRTLSAEERMVMGSSSGGLCLCLPCRNVQAALNLQPFV